MGGVFVDVAGCATNLQTFNCIIFPTSTYIPDPSGPKRYTNGSLEVAGQTSSTDGLANTNDADGRATCNEPSDECLPYYCRHEWISTLGGYTASDFSVFVPANSQMSNVNTVTGESVNAFWQSNRSFLSDMEGASCNDAVCFSLSNQLLTSPLNFTCSWNPSAI